MALSATITTLCVVDLRGVGPPTSSLQRNCSTTELQAHNLYVLIILKRLLKKELRPRFTFRPQTPTELQALAENYLIRIIIGVVVIGLITAIGLYLSVLTILPYMDSWREKIYYRADGC